MIPQLASAATLQPGVDCATGAAAPQAEYSLNVSALPLGAYAANTLSPDFTNAAGSVLANSFWTASSTKYAVSANTAQSILASKYCSRDMEVETWMRKGYVFLRLTPEGKAIYFNIDYDNSYLAVGIATSTNETAYYPGATRTLYLNSNLVGTIPGFSKTGTDNQRLTFGVEGFEIYAKFNGVEFMRIKDFHHMAAGRVALKAPANYGLRSTTVRNFADKAILSDLTAGVYDPRDFGFRSIQTTGSISAGSNTLTLAGPTSFAVGDFVIVEIGKEPGAGMRGTKGVGGTWPAKSYPNLTAMQADTSQIDGLYAWREDTGDVYRFASANSSWGSAYTWYTAGTPAWGQDYYSKKYYPAKAVPRALQARITAVSNSGATLTLDKPAVVSVTSASAYLDVAPILNFLVGRDIWYKFGGVAGDLRSFTPLNMKVPIPAGSYAVGGSILTGNERTNNVLYGQGSTTSTLFSPKGVSSASIWFNGSNNMLRDLRLVGNFGDNGFGLNWATSIIPFGYGPSGLEVTYTSTGAVTETVITQGFGFPIGIMMSGGNLTVQDIKVDNVWWAAVGANYCNTCWAYRVDSTVKDPFQTYIQWQFEWGDSTGGGCVDCTVTSPQWIIPGFAMAKSTNVQFIRPKGINAVFDANSVGNFLFQDPETTIKSMSQFSTSSFSAMGWIMNINTNLDNALPVQDRDKRSGPGGKIINPRFIVQGPINSSNNGLGAIVINNWNPNVTIEGGYIEGPNWQSPSTINTPVGVNSQGTSTVINGLRVVGTVNPALGPKGNVALGKNGIIRNCIVDLIFLSGTARKENCKTNAEYGALGISTGAALWPPRTSIILQGSITSSGSTSTVRGFAYGTTTKYMATTTESGLFGPGSFSVTVPNIVCATTYHAAAYAQNAVGMNYGNDITFASDPCTPSAAATSSGQVLGVSITDTSLVDTSCKIDRMLSRGTHGPAVTCLQKTLVAQKLLLEDSVTGYFGPGTEEAVRQFQASRGVVSNGTSETTGYGRVGQRTRALLVSLGQMQVQ
ncbi:peptidoglycan-binding protein [Candidatus Kaiserbacteria bacterium]|nr:peptidoglycan-binding protein [Candidatus Kaiserbacteria bacterium]